jgi:NAD(P)-dependent dehydrogenase (short-subunit alcohol dehydrogenase family)
MPPDAHQDMNANDQKIAVITGASHGIGAGIVDGYRQLGWGVVANALTIKPSGDPDLVTVDGDISEPGTTDRIIDAALSRFGRVDTLINDAGLYKSKPFTEYTADDYASVVGVNLTGFFLVTRRAIAEMLNRGPGHVVSISTTLAEYADSSRPALLAALTKGGLVSATKSLAVEYASRGIRVNALSLGVIRTPMNSAQSYDGLARLHPLGRVGEIDDVVRGILFLESSPFITGEILHIDGGQSAGHT